MNKRELKKVKTNIDENDIINSEENNIAYENNNRIILFNTKDTARESLKKKLEIQKVEIFCLKK